jgi:hypothetical protein
MVMVRRGHHADGAVYLSNLDAEGGWAPVCIRVQRDPGGQFVVRTPNTAIEVRYRESTCKIVQSQHRSSASPQQIEVPHMTNPGFRFAVSSFLGVEHV